MNACGQATAETGHVSISMTGMENTPVINYTVPTLTPNVLVDQQGYAAVGEKQAVVKGRQPVETFRLVDRETGETVYEGTVKQTDYNGELSLYIGTADFTDYTGEGEFYLECDNVGRSLTFSLKEDHYQELLEALCTDVHDRCQDRSITEDEIITLLEACEWYPQVLADDNGNDIPDLLESIADWLEKTANDTEKPEPENMCYVAVMAKFSFNVTLLLQSFSLSNTFVILTLTIFLPYNQYFMLPELTIFYPSFLIPVQRYKLLCSHTNILEEKFQKPPIS